jgi:tRNA-dihydrouridine synthase 1
MWRGTTITKTFYRCLIETSVDAVMSAEALLENPALYSGKIYDLDDLAYEYMMMAIQYRARHQEVKSHLFRILYTGLSEHVDVREKLTKSYTHDEFLAVVVELRTRRHGQDP